jgi:hypothetical protein
MKEPQYIVHKARNTFAHIWAGNDTVCRLGRKGIDLTGYRLTDDSEDKIVCRTCIQWKCADDEIVVEDIEICCRRCRRKATVSAAPDRPKRFRCSTCGTSDNVQWRALGSIRKIRRSQRLEVAEDELATLFGLEFSDSPKTHSVIAEPLSVSANQV